MDKMLKDKGYDDPDAREEILDEITKGGGTPEEQKANLKKRYTDRSDGTRKKLNKEKGTERRAKKASGEVPSGDTPETTPGRWMTRQQGDPTHTA
jgi:hypothetical protein